MKKSLVVSAKLIAGLCFTGASISTVKARSSPKLSLAVGQSVNHKLARTSVKLSKTDNNPQTTTALVFYYAGVQNNQKYVNKLAENSQALQTNFYDISQAKSHGIKGKMPNSAKVLYQVSLAGTGTAYYTIAHDKFYVANKHQRFTLRPASFATMVSLANKNNAGDIISQLANTASIQGQRSNTTNNDGNGQPANSQPVNNNSAEDSQEKAREAMNADPNIDPELKRRMNLSPDDPDYIQPTHDPDSWR